MKHAISYQGFLAVRKEPSKGAEMLTQVLFGESFSVLSSEGAWLSVKTGSDGFEGWIHEEGVQVTEEPPKPDTGPETDALMVIHPSVAILDSILNHPLILPAGSLLRASEGERFQKLSDEGWIVPGPGNDQEVCGNLLLSLPALQGGRCGFGFDAPGLVQMLCRCVGLSLPHSIQAQAGMGSIANFIHETRKGDLAFFHDGEDEITHVGMILDEGKIIHVSDQVRIDKLDQQGIYCVEKEKYTHRLRIVKSLRG